MTNAPSVPEFRGSAEERARLIVTTLLRAGVLHPRDGQAQRAILEGIKVDPSIAEGLWFLAPPGSRPWVDLGSLGIRKNEGLPGFEADLRRVETQLGRPLEAKAKADDSQIIHVRSVGILCPLFPE